MMVLKSISCRILFVVRLALSGALPGIEAPDAAPRWKPYLGIVQILPNTPSRFRILTPPLAWLPKGPKGIEPFTASNHWTFCFYYQFQNTGF